MEKRRKMSKRLFLSSLSSSSSSFSYYGLGRKMEIEQKSKTIHIYFSAFVLIFFHFWSRTWIATTVIAAAAATARLSFHNHFSILIQLMQNDPNKRGNTHTPKPNMCPRTPVQKNWNAQFPKLFGKGTAYLLHFLVTSIFILLFNTRFNGKDDEASICKWNYKVCCSNILN